MKKQKVLEGKGEGRTAIIVSYFVLAVKLNYLSASTAPTSYFSCRLMSLNKFVCNFCEKIILFLIKNY
jgi:hypothetical protein